MADRLAATGWTILGRNVRVGRAELDVVAIDPAGPALVIVEVRWRSRRDYGLAEETLSRAKWQRLRCAAFALVEVGRIGVVALPKVPLRFDLVVVEPAGRIRHHRHVA